MVLPSLRAGGAERVMLHLLDGLDRRRFDLHLLVINPSGPYRALVPPDVRLHGLGYKRVGRALISLFSLLRKLSPYAVLSSIGHLNLAVLMIKFLLPGKVRVFIRESSMPSMSQARGVKSAIFRVLYRLLYPKADRIICPGEAIGKDLCDNFRIRAKKIAIIPNPVDVGRVRAKMSQNGNPLPLNGIRLVAAGSLKWVKGFDMLIHAVKRLSKIRREIHLTILGEGPEKRNLMNQIRKMGLEDRITLAGFQKNPYPYLHYADLFVLSSRWEGMPNVVLESLACGTPVIAFHCPGGVGEIFDSPSQGVLVPAGDIEALGSAIAQWKGRKHRELKDSLLPNRFKLDSVVERYEKVMASEGVL